MILAMLVGIYIELCIGKNIYMPMYIWGTLGYVDQLIVGIILLLL